MKRVLLVALLTAGFFSTAAAQEKGLLYEVSGLTLSQPSYLFGTFHMVCPNDLQITDGIRKALGNSRQLFLELDFDDPALQTAMLTAMVMRDGKTLKDFLTTEDYALLDGYMQKNVGVPLATMAALKPIALLSVMYVKLMKCQPASYDMALAQLAGKEGKEVLGLETLDQQIAALDSVPVEEQLKGLLDIIRKPDEAQKELSELVAAYKEQDVDLLMKLIHESPFDGGVRSFEDELLNKRNMNWIPVIEKAAAEKPTFFAFGAGHLGGSSGVINLLRQKGYTVKAVQ